MRSFAYLLIRLVCLPADILGWLALLALWLPWGHELRIDKGILRMTFKPGSWPMRTWYRGWGGTTLGHAIIYSGHLGELLPSIEYHELVHVHQFEVHTFTAFLFVPFVPWWAGLLMITTAGFFTSFVAFFVAWARGGRAYRDSVEEAAAYDATELRG